MSGQRADIKVVLRPRTAEHVRIYWEKTQDEEIRKRIPLQDISLEKALRQFEASRQPDATSFGMCFLIFEKRLWGKGVGSQAARLFCQEVFSRYAIRRLGAFAYAENVCSLRALEKAGFREKERFLEEGRLSVYLEWRKPPAD